MADRVGLPRQSSLAQTADDANSQAERLRAERLDSKSRIVESVINHQSKIEFSVFQLRYEFGAVHSAENQFDIGEL